MKNLLFIILGLVILPTRCLAVVSPFIPLEVELSLCPERTVQTVDIAVKYRLADELTYAPATILSQEIDEDTNTAVFQIEVPGNLSFTPIHVAAFCSNSFGEGDPSNEVTFNNCDSLATADSDFDGIANNLEDNNCDNFFSPGDLSNPNNLDTDGDGIRDLIEVLSFTDPTNPGSSPRPKIFSGAPFDPDGDGNANPVVFRSSAGFWFIRDFVNPGNHLAFQFGAPGDIPFVYDSLASATTDVGVIRPIGLDYLWLFRGQGFINSAGAPINSLQFGIFGDNVIPGPWETPGVTSPAVARLFNGTWYFNIMQRDGSVRVVLWGGEADVPMVSDYDGDGLFDVAVYRPREERIYIIRSADQLVNIYDYGTETSEFIFRGDVTGDLVDDITFWEPINGTFFGMISDNGFNDALAQAEDPNHFRGVQLGLFFVHLPLSWNNRGGQTLYTVVDHGTGFRFYREDNNTSNPITAIQWGLPGDSQG